MKKSNADYSLVGDMREADRLHFIELSSNSTVLLIGGGFGYTMLSASGRCKKVFVLEPDVRQYAFLKQRAEEDGLENIVLQHAGSQKEIEDFVTGKVFDAIIVEEPSFLNLSSEFYETLLRSLKKGGEIYIAVQKRGSFRFVKNIARRLGFEDIRCFMVLPNHRTPLFFLPIYNIGAMRYFFRNLFYLVSTIPPEKMGKYRFFIGMARLGVKVLPVHFLLFLLSIAFLSKSVVARKT